MVAETGRWCFCIYGIIFNIIYNKNSPTSAGSEMNCRSEHKCSKEFYKQKRKRLFACWDCIIIIKREHIVQKMMIEIIHM